MSAKSLMLTEVWKKGLIVVVLAHGIAFAQESSRCQHAPFMSPRADQAALAIDRVEGQVVAAIPEMNGQLASASNMCMALFELRTGRQIAVWTTDAGGAFSLIDRESGRYVIVVSGSRSPRWHLPVAFTLSTTARGSRPARGLLLKLLLRNDKPSAIEASPIGNLPLRRELLGMLQVDQGIRKEAIGRGIGSISAGLKTQMAEIDSLNEGRLRAIVARYGWPGEALVGLDGADAALTIVQHLSAQTQRRLLRHVEASYHAGQIPGAGYANLVDHVRLNEGRPQLYGTVAEPFRRGQPIEFFPIEDPANVDVRRRAVGLQPLAVYRKFLRQIYFPNQHQ